MGEIPWTSHRLMLRLTQIEGLLVNDAPLRVGVGGETPLSSTANLAIVKMRVAGRTLPYIPGSSLKGVLRSACTALAKLKELLVCSGLSGQTCMDYPYLELGNAKLLEYVQRLLSDNRNLEALKIFHEKACLLCKVFGAPSFKGHLDIDDAYPIDEKVQVGIRAGIAIDRRTGAAYPRAYYQVEYVEPGTRFRFRVRATNLPNYALGLIAKALRMIHEGWVRIGGFKSRGFGRVHFEDLVFRSWDAEGKGLVMRAIDAVDEEVDLTGVAKLEDGWIVARGSYAWQALGRLEEVWERAKLG
ncbi:MAG: CRISPR-associated RAMP protein [Thermoprotei archaeon]|nr:MAG: CRISPR-associated RAMP protein [Thermoprotei archaeon]